MIQRASTAASVPARLPPAVRATLTAAGRPLDPGTRAWMEARFGYDLEPVRVHDDGQAAASAQAVNAVAYTVGTHVVFDQGRYAPAYPSGRALLAHELAHVVQQTGDMPGSGGIGAAASEQQAEAAARAVGRGNAAPSLAAGPVRLARQAAAPLAERIARIQSLLSYGVFDWAITDAEAIEALSILRQMGAEERAAALRQIDVGRLQENLPDRFLGEFSVMLIASGTSVGSVMARLTALLSTSFWDWAVTDSDARAALSLIETLPPAQRDDVLERMGRGYRRTLYENLSAGDQARFLQLWDERGERESAQQRAALEPAPAAVAPQDPVERKRQEFMNYLRYLPEPEPIDLSRSRATPPPVIDFAFIERETNFRYVRWVEREVVNPEYLTITPGDLHSRIWQQVYAEIRSAQSASEEIATRVRRQSERERAKWDEYQAFIRERTRRIGELNPTEANVQEQILRRFIDWVATHHGSPEYYRGRPLDIYERLGREVITPDVERQRQAAARAPQGDAARSAKLDEFLALGRRLRDYRQRFPYIIPVPSEGRDILVWGDPAQQQVFDAIAAALGSWAIQHYWDGDFTIQSPQMVLATLVRAHEPELRRAALEPLVFESIQRTELDPARVAGSFASTLGKVLLGAAIVGLVVGAEILTLGQVTWILVGLGAAMGTQAYFNRREEIEGTGVDVPQAETVVHAAGDVIGVSQVVEGATGLRLGTERRLGTIERSEQLGTGAGSLTGVLVGSRAFRLGRQTGSAWLSTIPRASGLPGVPVPRQTFLPGPAEHFPFGSGRQALPRPTAPNRIYRIMNNAEAAEVLRSGQLPTAAPGGTMPHKFFTLESEYAALFRQRALSQAEQLGRQAMAAERAGNVGRAQALRTQAQELIRDWHTAEGQAVLVEFELAPGALEHILNRSVTENLIGQYRGQNVYIFKLERGFNNIAVPSWQIGHFNGLIQAVRLHGWRAPFGPGGLSTPGSGFSVTPQGVQ